MNRFFIKTNFFYVEGFCDLKKLENVKGYREVRYEKAQGL